MTKLVLYGVGVLAALALLYWAADVFIVEPLVNQGIVLQKAKDQPIIDGLTKQRDQALAANKSLSADLAGLRATVGAQNASIRAWQADSEAASAAAASALAKARREAENAKDAAETARLTQIATTIPVNQTAEADCAEAHSILADLARARRLRDQPAHP